MVSALVVIGRRCSRYVTAARSPFFELGLNSSNFVVRAPAPRLFLQPMTMSRLLSSVTMNSHCWSTRSALAHGVRPFCSQDMPEETISNEDHTSHSANVADHTVVIVRPFSQYADTNSVISFFAGLDIAPNGILFLINPVTKKRSGSVLVAFTSPLDASKALRYTDKIYQNHIVKVSSCDSKVFADHMESIKEYAKRDCIPLRMSGLPYRLSEEQIAEIFDQDLSITKDSVEKLSQVDGSFSGEALVQFGSEQDRERAMEKKVIAVDDRVIHLVRITPEEYYMAYNRNKHDLKALELSEKDTIKLLSLPFSCSMDDVIDFLGDFKDKIVPDGVRLVYGAHRRFAGVAYVKMVSEEVAAAVVQSLQDKTIGNRLISVNQCFTPKESSPPMPQNQSGSGTTSRKRLMSTLTVRGFPYATTVTDLVDFFSNFNLTEDDIRMTYDHLGRPTGNAYVTFASTEDAQRAIHELNFKYIGHRYIELL